MASAAYERSHKFQEEPGVHTTCQIAVLGQVFGEFRRSPRDL